MSYVTLLKTRDARGIVTLTLNRPDVHNAMDAAMMDDLSAAAAALGADASVRAVILTGQGASFCAGGDLGWMRAQMTASRPQRMAEARRLADMLHALNTMPKPLIGAVNGAAFGGGVGIASVCDVVLAAEGAKFGLTETRLGLIPATISPYVLARMGEGKARRVFMSARRFDAAEALALDLVARVVPAAALMDEAMAEAEAYLACAPGAVGAAKALARSLGAPITPEVITETIERLADTWEHPEAAEGIAAFFEKRKPRWA
ncbi:MAG: crotonase/enoyl-CoA hydratase family protein [Paracoccaceae bacterium]